MADNALPVQLPPSLSAIRKNLTPVRNVNEMHEQSLSLLDRIALGATNIVGTMGFFFACAIMVTIPLLFRSAMPVIQYVSSGYLQLILLPLIMVGQNLQSKHSEARSENDYQVNMKAEREIEVLYKHLEYQNAILLALMKKLDVRLEDVMIVSQETLDELQYSIDQRGQPESAS